jgi:NADH dehydrogenase
MILVVGGTGRLGSLLANRLVARGREVRVVSRGLVPPAAPLHERVERVVGDVRDPARMQELVVGAEVIVLAMHGFAGPGRVSPRTVDHHGSRNVIAAAGQTATDIVMVSIAGASKSSGLELARVKYGVEEQLRASPCPWTVVRSDAFAQTWFDVLEQTAATSHRPLVFGRGTNPIGWVDVHEVAALVEHAALEPSLRGRTLEISGPERLTLEQLATLLMEHHGWTGKPRRVPRWALRLMTTLAAPVRPDLARQARASLAMDLLPPVDDQATRAAFPGLPAMPVSRLLAQSPTQIRR